MDKVTFAIQDYDIKARHRKGQTNPTVYIKVPPGDKARGVDLLKKEGTSFVVTIKVVDCYE